MLRVGVSIVSHNNQHEIIQNHANYKSIENVEFEVCITDNTGSPLLRKFCEEKQYLYVLNETKKGFGENNNQNIAYFENKDLLLIVNPDVKFDLNEFVNHINRIYNLNWDICGARVVEENGLKKSSHRRLFPALLDPIISFIFKKKLFLLNPNISSDVDWVGGSFMIIRPKSFLKLGGFDQKYFMYYEDIDLCKRAIMMNLKVYYFSDFSFFHGAKRAGHKLFSKAFWWNFRSMIIYFKKYPTLKLFGPNKF